MERLPCTRIISSRYHVESCNFSPDGKLLAACFGDFTVRLLRIGDNSSSCDDHAHSTSIHIDLYWVIKEHKSNVWCARFSPDGLLLCTCSSDKTAKIWNVNSLILERNFDFHTDTVWSCCFAPANSSPRILVATGSSDKRVKVWDTENGEVLHDLGGYGDAVDCLDFSSNGELLCTSCRDGVVKIWTNLSIAKNHTASSASKECNADCFVEPICLDLTAVNRSASRFCKYSTIFSSYLKDSESTAITDNEAATTACASNNEDTHIDTVTMDIFSKSDPSELLFAGGPENTFGVWTIGDIMTAFRNLLSEGDTESLQMYQDFNKEISSNTDEHPNSVSEVENDCMIDDHVTDDGKLQDSDSKGEFTLSNQRMGPADVETSGTQLKSIVEEEETQSDLSERTDQDNSNPETTLTSLENSVIYGESSYVSDEPFSFYKVEPRWTLTDHLSTVWDCCTAALHNSKHDILSKGETANDTQDLVLISCSGDRTLR